MSFLVLTLIILLILSILTVLLVKKEQKLRGGVWLGTEGFEKFCNAEGIPVITPMPANYVKGNPQDQNSQDSLLKSCIVKRSSNKVFIPLNFGATNNYSSGTHWVLLYLEYDNNDTLVEVYYFDSFGKEIPIGLKNRFKKILGNEELVIKSNTMKFQNDGHSCGQWVCKAIKALNDHGVNKFEEGMSGDSFSR